LRFFNHEPCGSWHSPSNAHAYRLYVFKELRGFRCVADQ
jgi:hypothetical protein